MKLLEEMVNSSPGAGNLQDEPGASGLIEMKDVISKHARKNLCVRTVC